MRSFILPTFTDDEAETCKRCNMKELVLCQDCRFYDVWTLDPPRGNCTLHHRLRIASWYCADGKKRDVKEE